MGYDSRMWLEGSKGDILFVESNQEYITINKEIPPEKIIKYLYEGITVAKSYTITTDEILQF
jgi:hypothetical protein